jgi:type II secretory pathway pseudopilin PulG
MAFRRRPVAASRRPSLSSERGSFLVEVMVGAVVLAIVTFAVLDGMSGAADTGERNRQRSVASTLAQQDIERLRSFEITDLSNYRETRTVNMGGVNYTVVSRTDWVRDASGLISCTNDDTQAEYLKITATAWSPASEERPVREVSLLTPAPGAFSATSGTAAIKLTDRDGNPHSGVGVSLDGSSDYSDSTNDVGCAIFGMIPAGNYEVNVNGLVGWGGEDGTTNTVTVQPAKTSLRHLELEPPGTLRARFERPDGTAGAWNSVTVANAKLPGGTKTFTQGSSVATIDSNGLFPFLDGYGVYAGSCRANNPAFWDATYFSTSGKGFVQLEPGDFLEPVNVQMGTLTVRVRRETTGNPAVDSRVTLRQQDTGTGCTAGSLTAFTNNTGTDGDHTFVVPFGTYRVCANNVSGTGTQRRRESTGPAGTGTPAAPRDVRVVPPGALAPTITIWIPNSGSSATCSTS